MEKVAAISLIPREERNPNLPVPQSAQMSGIFEGKEAMVVSFLENIDKEFVTVNETSKKIKT